MLDVAQFRRFVVDPALHHINLYSEAASDLLMGTALAESNLVFLRQKGDGPARGLFQIEPATHRDVVDNFIKHRPSLRVKVRQLMISPEVGFDDQLVVDLIYAAAIARIIYYRKPQALPAAGDWRGYADYWKAHYNTPLGAGTPEHFFNAAWRAGLVKGA